MFSARCGLPLQPVGLMSHNWLEYSRRFFEGGHCLTEGRLDHGRPPQPEPLHNPELMLSAGGRSVFHALARYDADGHAEPADDRRREFTHVDILPTLADAPQPTLAERFGLAHVNARLSCRSPLFQRLWVNAT